MAWAKKLNEPISSCGQNMTGWQYQYEWPDGGVESQVLGVSPENENIPLMLNYTTIEPTTHERTEKIFCFSNFIKQHPPAKDLVIPSVCQQEGIAFKSTPNNGNQRFMPSYFAIPSANRAPSYDCLAT